MGTLGRGAKFFLSNMLRNSIHGFTISFEKKKGLIYQTEEKRLATSKYILSCL